MNRALSLHLDGLRALAAIVVLLSHWAYARFTDGSYAIIRDLNIGSDAVMVFFVLSGFIIAYTVEAKDVTLRAFAFNRATRIYSVALPALLLTQIFDLVGQRLDPASYDGWWLSDAGLGRQVLAALTFTSETWFSHTRIGTNGPWWSLSYEVWYYILFACLFYLRRRAIRLVCAAVAVVLMGPKILLLAPSWWLGVWSYRLVARGLDWSRPVAWAAAIVPAAAYIVFQAAGLPALLLQTTQATLGESFVTYGLRFSDEFIWNALIGLLVALHLLGVAALVRNAQSPLPAVGVPIRWLAGASFSLYLVHYPALQLFDAMLPAFPVPQLRHVSMLVLTVCVCFVFASVFERRLPMWRALLRRAAPRQPQGAGAAQLS